MKTFETSWTTSDNLQLYGRGWEPETPPRALICLVHGIGEHSGRYTHVAQFLTSHGFAILTFDLRGHGKSGGQRGHAPTFESMMSDIDLLFQEADRRYPDAPRFLYGHSLGGLLVLNYALRRKPKLVGVISTSAGLRSALQEQKIKVGFAKLAASVAPSLSLPTDLDANGLSRDPAVVEAYKSDPLVHDQMTLAMARNTLQAIDWVFQHAAEFPVPLLMVHGTADPIVYASGSQEFAGLVRGECTLKLWDGLKHETHNEPEKEQVLAYTLAWLENKLSSR